MKRRIPSITALLCFEASARTENFGQAAKELNMTQSALSRQVQVLEKYIKQQLFTRAKQRVKLTAAGKALIAELSPQLEMLEATMVKIQSHDRLEGALNIGAYPTFGSRWLIPKIVELSNEQPDVTINTITYLSNEDIDPSLIDIAIAQGDPPWNGFRADYFLPETLVAIANPESLSSAPADPLELLQERILQHVTRPDSWEIWLENQGYELPNRIIGPMFHQFEMLIDAVKAGHGIAIVPKLLVADDIKAGRIIKAHDYECLPDSAYYLLTPSVKVGTQKIERVRRWLLERAGKNEVMKNS